MNPNCDICDGVHTPIYHTYRLIKRSAPNEIIFVRLGDFYEAFADVDIIRDVCNLLEHRVGAHRIVGFPLARLDEYGARLAERGYTVRVFERTTSGISQSARGIGA